MDVAGQRVTVMGLGRHGGGAGATRWLAKCGARVTVSDLLSAEVLNPTLTALADPPVEWHLGGHDDRDFRDVDLLVVNPAIKPDHPLVRLAREHGARVTSEIELFLRACRGRTVGVTGSVGKSSTAAMLDAIFRSAGRRSWLGGNIGGSLLDDVERIGSGDVVVLELSSFQLHWLDATMPMPSLAVVTNCTPNHLDWHPNFEHYRAAKQRLVREQIEGAIVVLGPDLLVDPTWRNLSPSRVVRPWADERIPALAIAGRHQRINAACAAAAAESWGCPASSIEQALAGFAGLPHRLQLVGERSGRRFYDDSKATTPESTLAAIESLDGRAWWLIGGADKGAEFDVLLAALARHAAGAAFYGTTGSRLFALASERHPGLLCTRVDTLRAAIEWCWRASSPGESIVLSPACASLDQFDDYVARARHFVESIAALDG
jgi:UDP-N-acetylmuramoylalanine--D-glutamate ligase